MSLRSLLLICHVLGGCAAAGAPVPPTCDGQARRPANPYGSVLLPPPATSVAPAPAAEASPPAAPSAGGCA